MENQPKNTTEDSMRKLIQQSPLSVHVATREGRSLLTNDSWDELWGIEPGDERSVNLFEDERLRDTGLLEYVRRGTEGETVITPMLLYDPAKFGSKGEKRWIRGFVHPVVDEDGSVFEVALMLEDVTERKKAQDVLENAEEPYRSLVDHMPVVLYIDDVDASNTALYRSPHVEEMLGYPPEAFCTEPYFWHDLLHPDDRERVLAENERTNETGEPFRMEYRMLHANGHSVWVRDEAILKRHPDGRPAFWQGIFSDITERIEFQESLRESEERFRTLIQNASDVVSVVSADGTMSYISPSVERILGYASEDLVDYNVFDFIHPDDVEHVRESFKHMVVGSSTSTHEEYRFKAANGDWRYVESVASNQLQGVVGGMVVNSRDITKRKLDERRLREAELRFRTLVEHVPVVVYITDVETSATLYDSPRIEQMLGYPPDTCQNDPFYWSKILHPEDRDRVLEREAADKERGFFDHEYRVFAADGRTVWLQDAAVLVRDAEGKPLHWQGVLSDITQLKEAEAQLRGSEERFRGAFENAPLGVALINLDRRYLRVNSSLCRILGYSEEELLTKTTTEVTHPKDKAVSVNRFYLALKDDKDTHAIEKRYVRSDGREVWAISSITLVRDSEGNPDHFVSFYQDITDRKLLEQRMEERAFHDPLTGLANRSLFRDRLDLAIARLERHRELMAVLFIDLDNFKAVNDSLGHDVGDKLLVEVGQKLKDCVRPEDTVARLGGDEFAVLLGNVANTNDISRAAERITARFFEPFEVDGHEVYTGTSIGIAIADTPPYEPEELLKDADRALYSAKQQGKGRFEIFDTNMSNDALERLDVEGGLRRALEREEFQLYYQPKISLETGRTVSMEALLRWWHPERGLLEPREFLPVVEEIGLDVLLGEWVLREVCLQGKKWQDRYAGHSIPRVCANLSPRHFRQGKLPSSVVAALKESGARPELVSLEISEKALMYDAEDAVERLRDIEETGVNIVMDGFGLAYSSLTYLKRLPLDFIKLDQQLFRDIDTEPANEMIVEFVVKLAGILGWNVVAHGIETKEQLDHVRRLNCDLAQGYVFSEPLSPEDASEFLDSELDRTS